MKAASGGERKPERKKQTNIEKSEINENNRNEEGPSSHTAGVENTNMVDKQQVKKENKTRICDEEEER